MGSLTVYSSNSTQITIASVTTSSVGNFTVVNPPSTRPFSFTLTTYKVDTTTGLAYAIDTRTTTPISCTAGALYNVAVTPTIAEVNAITTYTIVLTIKNKLQLSSFINVVFPSQIAIQVGTASCSISSHTCTVVSSQNVSVSVLSAIAANTVLTVVVNNVKNAN